MFALPLFLVLVLAALLAACEAGDEEDLTSPSARALLGSTSGTPSYEVDNDRPEPTDGDEDWEFTLNNARYERLEDRSRSIQVVTRLQSDPGTRMEMWLWTEGGHTPYHWVSEGTTGSYNGVLCFQLRLEDREADESDAVMQLETEQYHLTIGFRDEETGEWVEVKDQRVAGTVPDLAGPVPGAESQVGRELIGCPAGFTQGPPQVLPS